MDHQQLKRVVRRAALTILSVAVATVGLRFALQALDWASFQTQLQQLDWRWLALAVAFDVASYVAQGLRWGSLLNGANPWQTTRAIYAGLFVNEIIPLRPGEAIRSWLAARDLKMRLWDVLPTVVTERLMDGFWLTAALLAALAVAPLPQSLARATWVMAAVFLTLFLAAWWLGGKRIRFLRVVRSGLSNHHALLMSSGFLIGQGLAFWAVARASHVSMGLAAAFVVMLVVRIGTMVPMAPANLGAHQLSTVLGLSLYGIPRGEAAGFSIVVFTVLTLPLLVIGFCACVSAGVRWRDVRQSVAQVGEPVPA